MHEEKEWYEIITKKEKEIIERGQEAYASAFRNPFQKYRVELYEDGDISVLGDLAGGSHVTKAVALGQGIVLFDFCFQEGQDINLSDESIIDKAEEKAINIDKFLSIQEEQGKSLELTIKDNLNELEPDSERRKLLEEMLDECLEDEIQMDIDNYSYDEVMKKLDICKDSLDVPEKKQNTPNLFMTGRSR